MCVLVGMKEIKMEARNRRWRLIYTVNIFIIQLIYGVCINILGPGLVDFGYIYGVSLEKVSYAASLVQGGYLIGSCIGWSYRWLNRQLLLVGFIILEALSTAALPFYPSLAVYFIASTLTGIGSGAWDSSSSAWLVEMWHGQASAPVLQAFQFMFGLGGTVAPMIAAPFVHGDNNATLNYTFTGSERQKYLAIPFGVSGLTYTAPAITLLLIYFLNAYRKSDYEQELNEKPSIDQVPEDMIHIPHRYWRIALMGCCVGFYCATEVTYLSFSTALWINTNTTSNPFEPAESAHLLSILFASYTVGRLASAFITTKLQPGYVLVYHYFTMLASFSLLYFGRDSHTLVYVGTVLLGYGLSATWPAIFGFTEQHAKLTERVGAVFSFLAGLASLITPLVLAPFVKTRPLMLFAVELTVCTLSFICFILAALVIRHGQSHTSKTRSHISHTNL